MTQLVKSLISQTTARLSAYFIYLVLLGILIISSCSLPNIPSLPFANSNVANSNATLLFDPGEPEVGSIVWSPSGDKFAVTAVHWNGLGSTISILDMETKKIEIFADKFDSVQVIEAIGWSSDERQLIFSSMGRQNFKTGIWISDANNFGNARLLVVAYHAAWSDIGGLVFQRSTPGTQDVLLFVYDSETGTEKLVFNQPGFVAPGYSWSPDGNNLVFWLVERLGHVGGNIYVVNIETGEQAKLTYDDGNFDPAWSPTADMIAYSKVRGEAFPRTYSLHIMKTDGSCDIEVPDVGSALDPNWSPDGSQIAFINNGVIYLVDLLDVFGEKFLRKEFPCNLEE